ncbi:HesA/MoeB/ThiF family protein [Falsirhodobacter sp. alg1]|uniref:HesA/MoeB/ThiF family protein n=1 Tax=Falsirhodobacter sp. alg1 TaxID=1472418 RepID=UPI0005EE20A1|nr:HesA/MoeB/ThiF family protein [Falsirhodobacter sp. alg1]
MMRYARQMQVAAVGTEGQSRIGHAHVLIVGAGGLGVPALQYLTGAGIGHITLIDPDRVEESNLHRQPIYGRHLGAPKALAAQMEMAALNADTVVTPVVSLLDPANAPPRIAAADIVLDCADSFAASYTLSDLCLAAGVPLISASALETGGYVGGFCGGAPSLRAVFPDLPDRAARCETAGVMGPMVGMLGAAQAQMALAVLIGIHPSPLGQILRFDGLRPSTFRFDGVAEPQSGPRFVARTDLTPQDLVIELRDATEAPVPAVPWAVRNGTPDPARRTVFACRSGLRAWHAAATLSPNWPGEIALLAAGDSE